MKSMKLFAVALLICIVSAQDKVKLDFYGEAFCPFCQQFLGGGVNKTLEAAGVLDIIDYHYYPFGNAYYNVSSCGTAGYNKTYSMFCWLNRCGVASPPSDCFTGTVLCQHGSGECTGNIIESCANSLFSTIVAAQFNYCFEVCVFGLLCSS